MSEIKIRPAVIDDSSDICGLNVTTRRRKRSIFAEIIS